MKKVILDYLTIVKFKGILSSTIKFSEGGTLVEADNGVGKSTLFSASAFLLTGKDQYLVSELKEFKPLDSNREPLYPRDTYSVEGGYYINEGNSSKYVRLKRSFKQKFTKPRGQDKEVVNGHITEYEINTLPSSLSEFETYINNMFGGPDLIMLCSNPYYFAETLTSDKQRELLFTILPKIEDADILSYMSKSFNESDESIARLKGYIESQDSFKEIKSRLSSKVKKLVDEVKQIPPQIKATEDMRPDLDGVDFNEVDAKIKSLKANINKIELELNKPKEESTKELAILKSVNLLKIKLETYKGKCKDTWSSNNNKHQEMLVKLNNKLRSSSNKITELDDSIKTKVSKIGVDVKNEIAKLTSEISVQNESLIKDNNIISNNAVLIKNYDEEIKSIDDKLVVLRAKIEKIASEVFEDKFTYEVGSLCKDCGTLITEATIVNHSTEAMKAFEVERVNAVNELNTQGKSLAKEKKGIESKKLLTINESQNTQRRIDDTQSSIKLHTSKIESCNLALDEELKNVENLKLGTKNVSDINNSKLLLEIANLYKLRAVENNDNQNVSDEISLLEGLIDDNNETYKENIADSNSQVAEILKSIKLLESDEEEDEESPVVSAQKKFKESLETELNDNLTTLAKKSQNEQADKNIKALELNMQKLSIEIADLENEISSLDNFDKSKVRIVEEMIPRYFNYVSFELFELLANGSYRECCNVLVNGISYTKTLNNAAKINAGVEIVLAFQRSYGVSFPIFIDNKESVSVLPLIDNSQHIVLEKVTNIKELRITEL